MNKKNLRLFVIDGPNLNLLGSREPEIYGKVHLADIHALLKAEFSEVNFTFFQSNIEGEIIDAIHAAGANADGIIINPAGYSHTSVAIADALTAVGKPKIEVHLSNIHAREEYRHHSLTGARCNGVISGLGPEGYLLAVRWFSSLLA